LMQNLRRPAGGDNLIAVANERECERYYVGLVVNADERALGHAHIIC